MVKEEFFGFSIHFEWEDGECWFIAKCDAVKGMSWTMVFDDEKEHSIAVSATDVTAFLNAKTSKCVVGKIFKELPPHDMEN